MDPIEFNFKHPTTIQVSGLTRFGKTRLVQRILNEQLIHPFAIMIVLPFSEWQPGYESIRDRHPCIEFKHGLRDERFDSL